MEYQLYSLKQLDEKYLQMQTILIPHVRDIIR